jgi:leader peptidase (prepilin peptidase) / N-methyltransferase
VIGPGAALGTPEAALWGTAGATLFGVILGSFLNVCIARWPEGESVVTPRSRCPACRTPIRPIDNVPLLSWLWLLGRCRWCRAPIPAAYPLTEFATGVIWGGMFGGWLFLAEVFGWGMRGGAPQGAEALTGAVFLTILLGIARTDARTFTIPDPFSLGGLALALGLSFLPGGVRPLEAILGAAVGFGVLAAVGWGATRALGKPALGGGDVKMMAMVGGFVGATGVLLTLFLGSILGIMVFGPMAIWRRLRGGETEILVPFGVFLALGGAMTWIVGDRIIGAYLDWFLATAGGAG